VASCHWPPPLIHTLTGPAKIKGTLPPSVLPPSVPPQAGEEEAHHLNQIKLLEKLGKISTQSNLGIAGALKMMGEVMAMGSSTMLGSASAVVSGPPAAAAKKATATASLASPFLGTKGIPRFLKLLPYYGGFPRVFGDSYVFSIFLRDWCSKLGSCLVFGVGGLALYWLLESVVEAHFRNCAFDIGCDES
jgi:hypothetical protein